MPQTIAIIVAAGSGLRFGGDTPKQFLELDGAPVCVCAGRCFRKAVPDVRIIYVLPERDFSLWEEFMKRFIADWNDVAFVRGGKSRWESVKNALGAIGSDTAASATVLVHDGARPLVDEDTIRAVIRASVNTDGAVPVIPVTDSLRKIGEDGVSSEPVDRSSYRAVQTPQGSRLWRLRQAYEMPYDESFTDDASVLAAAGFSNIVLVKGSARNIKITTPEDLKIATCLI